MEIRRTRIEDENPEIRKNQYMVRGNICYKCGEELEDWYVEEGDLTISRKKIVCPFCGWSIEGAMDFYEEEYEEDAEEAP